MSWQHDGMPIRPWVAGVTALAALMLCASTDAARAVPDDEPNLLSRQTARVGSASPVPVGDLPRHRVDLGDESVTVADLASQVFRGNAALLRQFRAAPDTAVFGRPSSTLTTTELRDSYVLNQTTGIVVTDPTQLARVSSTFREFRGATTSTPPSYSELPAEARAGLDRLWAETTSMPAGHPLRRAGEGGRQALLDAVHAGVGEFSVTDTFTVAKSGPGDDVRSRPALRPDGLVDYSAAAPTAPWLPGPLFRLPVLAPPAVPPPDPAVPAPALHRAGRHSYSASFLTGFTRGRSWDWERRWNFPSGFFRLSLGASYGLGLRVPLQVSGTMSPTRIRRSAGVDSPDPVELSVAARPFDAGADHYRRTGLASDQVFAGREFVLNAQTYYGLRLRALFMNIAHVPRTTLGLTLDRDWRPPFGNYHGTPAGSPTFTIPPGQTHTEFSPLPGLSGWAQLGLNVNGTGRALITQQPVVAGERGAGRRLEFTDATSRHRTFLLPALRPEVGDSERLDFGFRLSDPRYVADLDLTPMLRAGVTAGYRSFSRSFRTGWVTLPAARVSLGNLSLGRHPGTTADHVAQPGRKTFARTAGDAGTDRAVPGVLALRAPDDTFIRAGLGEGSALGPGARTAGGWERFQTHVARIGNWRTNPRFTLRSAQNRQYVRAGVGPRSRLAAVSPLVSPDWEWFRRVELAGGREWALKSAHSGRFVVRGRDGYLEASGRDLSEALRLRPVSLDNGQP